MELAIKRRFSFVLTASHATRRFVLTALAGTASSHVSFGVDFCQSRSNIRCAQPLQRIAKEETLTVLLWQACVRRRAVMSVRANPACPDDATAERAVSSVWESCFNDTRPFDEVSRHTAFPSQDSWY